MLESPQVHVDKPTCSSDLDAVRRTLKTMLDEGRSDEALELIIDLLTRMRAQNSELRMKVFRLLRLRRGRKNEGVSSEQLDLFLSLLDEQTEGDVPGFENKDEDNEESKEEGKEETDRKKTSKKPRGRRPFPDHLPRRTVQSLVEQEQRRCTDCGNECATVRFEQSQMLEFVEGHFEVVVCERELVACPNTTCDSGVITAPTIPRVIPGGMAGVGLLTHVLLGKYQQHLPLYRMRQRFLSNFQVDLAESTLSDWMLRLGLLVAPLVALILQKAIAAHVLQGDATYIKVQDSSHPDGIRQSHLWCLLGDGRYAAMVFTTKHTAQVAQAIFGERTGWLQLDAHKIYDGLFDAENATATEVGCWAHARRPARDALNGDDLRAAIPVNFIKKLFKIEREADKKNLTWQQRTELRKQKSAPIVKHLESWVDESLPKEPPGTGLHAALTYLNNQRKPLRRFLEDGRLPLTTNAVERLFRDCAIGRRNYMFFGSDKAGHRSANIYSILATCKLNNVNPRDYLLDVLPKLAQGPPQEELERLLPDVWARERAGPD